MTYEEAVRYILDIPRFTKKNDMMHTKAFLEYLGDPQDDLKVIHVAGLQRKRISVCVPERDASIRGKARGTVYVSASYPYE